MSEANKQQQNNAPPNISVSPIVTNEISTDANEMAANKNAEINAASGAVSSNKMNAGQLSPNVDKKKAATKRTPSKRLSFVERAQKESEELVRNMGGSLELEGGRRTRSSARGTPTRVAVSNTPPPSKKSRNSPSTTSAVTTPTPRGRGRGRKLHTTALDIDEETNTTATTSGAAPKLPAITNKGQRFGNGDAEQDNAPSQKEIEKQVKEKAEVKQEGLSADEERQQQSPNKAKMEVVSIDKDVGISDGDTATQKELSLKEKCVVTLNSVPEESSSQMNEEKEQAQVVTEELKKEDDSVRSQRESSVETAFIPKSNISYNKSENQNRQSPRSMQQQQQQISQQQQQKLESTTTLMEKSAKLTDTDKETKESESVQPIIINENDDDEPMDIDSSSKSNDVVEIIESDSNMAESPGTIKIDSTKTNVVALTPAATSDNRATITTTTTAGHKLNETLPTGSVINIIEDDCDESATNDNINTKGGDVNAMQTIDIKAGGDHEMDKKNASETFNCNKSSVNNDERKTNNNENEQNERESSTPAAATTTNDAMTMTPPKI